MHIALVAIGAFVGAVARLVVTERIGQRFGERFPAGLLVANLSGSFALGVIATVITERGGAEDISLLVSTGMLGAYTSFSSFSCDTVRLFEAGAISRALANIAGNMIGCTLLALAGVLLALAVV